MTNNFLADLPEEVFKFLIALIDASHPISRGVGSIVNAATSQKIHARTTFNITLDPTSLDSKSCILFISPTVCSDLPIIYQWMNGYSGSADTYSGTVNTQSIFARVSIPLPYPSTSVGQETASSAFVNGRIISVTLKITPLGAVLNRSGEVVFYDSPGHSDIADTATTTWNAIATFLQNQPTGRRLGLGNGRTHSFTVSPISEVEMNFIQGEKLGYTPPNCYFSPYSPSVNKFSSSGNVNDASPIAALYFTEPTALTSYRVDVHTVVEYIGKPSQASHTRSHSMEDHGRTMVKLVHQARQDHYMDPHKHLFSHVVDHLGAHMKAKAKKAGTSMVSQALTHFVGDESGAALAGMAMALI